MKAKTADKLKQEANERYELGRITLEELKKGCFHLNELVRNTPIMER
jgi:hypothetical protein